MRLTPSALLLLVAIPPPGSAAALFGKGTSPASHYLCYVIASLRGPCPSGAGSGAWRTSEALRSLELRGGSASRLCLPAVLEVAATADRVTHGKPSGEANGNDGEPRGMKRE